MNVIIILVFWILLSLFSLSLFFSLTLFSHSPFLSLSLSKLITCWTWKAKIFHFISFPFSLPSDGVRNIYREGERTREGILDLIKGECNGKELNEIWWECLWVNPHFWIMMMKIGLTLILFSRSLFSILSLLVSEEKLFHPCSIISPEKSSHQILRSNYGLKGHMKFTLFPLGRKTPKIFLFSNREREKKKKEKRSFPDTCLK